MAWRTGDPIKHFSEKKNMENTPQRVFLLIADISGYTKYMTRKRKSLAHAQAIITELIESIITEIRIPLHIIEVEGRFEDYDELGRVGLYAHYPGITGPNPEETQDDSNDVSLYQKMKQTMKIGLRGMFIMLGLMKQPKFRNLPG